jgi:curved DNA-binding protein
MDYYNILGVPKTATQQEIKQAYRRLASKHHPDRGGDTAEFQKIEEAYRTLSDDEKRHQYDNPNPHQNFAGFPFANGNINIFEEMFNQFNRQRQQRIYTVTVFITLEQVASGEIETINVNTPAGGKTFQISVPKGIEDGQKINYENLMPDGVLQIMFRIHPHPIFERRRLDLISNKELSVIDLILGTTISFTTIYNQTLEITIHPRTKPGSSLRISGKGLEASNQRGDQYILITALIPDTISTELITALEQERNKTLN